MSFLRSKLKQPAKVSALLKKIETIKAGKPNAFNVDFKGKKFFGEKMLATIAAVAASKVIQDLTFTADIAGVGGNSISLTYIKPAAASQALSVSVSGNDITVSLATDVGALAISTANDIKTALDGNAAAAALINTAVSGVGTTVQAAQAQTFLTGGADTYIAPACNLTGDVTKITFTYDGVNYQLLRSDIQIIKRVRSRKYVAHTNVLTVV